MKNKCTVIHINGLTGVLIAGFLIMCAIAGFVIFPAWCCMHIWNALASIVSNMPVMQLKHGALLWVIIALASYAAFFGKFKIAFVSKTEAGERFRPNKAENIELSHSVEKSVQVESEREEIKK